MRTLLLWLLLCGTAFGQGVRFDLPPVLNSRGVPIANPNISLCTGLATINGTTCSIQAQSFTDITLTTPCAGGSPVTLANSNVCRATGDALGNAGFWLNPGAYIYCVTAPSTTGQCYNLNAPVGTTAGGGPTMPSATITGALTAAQIETIRMADQFCSGSTDPAVCINNADTNCGVSACQIWAVPSLLPQNPTTALINISSNHVLVQFPGTMNYTAPTTPTSGGGAIQFISVQDAGLICLPGCIMKNVQTGYAGTDNSRDLVFVDSGSTICNNSLSVNANEGTTSVTVVGTPTGCAIGQDINIEDARFSEVNKICNIAGSVITLCGPLENSYSTARSPAGINVYNWARRIFIDGMNVQGGNGSGTAVYFQSALDFKLDHHTVKGITGRCFLAGRWSSRGTFSNFDCDGQGTTLSTVPGAEYYIATSHITASNGHIHDYLSHGFVAHGFHKTFNNIHTDRNGLSGFSCDSGAKIQVVNLISDANGQDGVTIAGAALNTAECTEVELTGVTASDNGRDGLHAGDGSNVMVRVNGGLFIRNLGVHGGVYLNNVQPGSGMWGAGMYGNTVNGLTLDGTISGLTLNTITFKAPANSTANATDINVLATGNVSNSTIWMPLYAAATPITVAGTLDLTTTNYFANAGATNNSFPNNGVIHFNSGRFDQVNALNFNEASNCTFGGASQDSLCGDSQDHMLYQNLNSGGAAPLPLRGISTGSYTNATTTPSNITGLSFAVAASRNYIMSCDLYWQGSASTAGLDITITGPSTPTSVFYSYDEFPTLTTSQTAIASSFGSKLVGNATVTATTNLHGRVTMGLRNGANAGTVQVQGSATGTGTVTVQNGSFCVEQ